MKRSHQQSEPVFKSGPKSESKLRDALMVFEELSRHRNLNSSVAIFFFVVSGGLSIRAFFLIIDLPVWGTVGGDVAAGMVSLSWGLIFPIWILTFLGIMSALHALGIDDLRAVARSYLSKLRLGTRDLRKLRDLLAARNLRHGRLFLSAITDLTKPPPAGV